MELNRNVWYVQLFFWSLRIYGAFRKDFWNRRRFDPEEVARNGTNLCFFMRVIIVYVPLILLSHAALFVAAAASVTLVPISFFGAAAYGRTLVFLAATAAIIFLIIKMITFAQRHKPAKQTPKKRPVAKQPTGPSFLEVSWAYVVAVKRKVCPLITFTGLEKGASR
ncbi:MAG: hypothetical protein Q7R48_03615 [bacterium]|nr:hypothetical protein [bacterium]